MQVLDGPLTLCGVILSTTLILSQKESRMSRAFKQGLSSLALAAAAVAAVPAQAGPFSTMTVFGDSLSDTGNVLALTTAFTPNPFPVYPGAQGRFANGPVWVEHLATALGLPAGAQSANQLLTGPATVTPLGVQGGMNYAYGGARTGFNGSAGPATGLLGQLAAWNGGAFSTSLSRAADSNGLYVVVIGGNDLRDARTANPGSSAADAAARTASVNNAVQGLFASVGLLAQAGARHFLLATMPDLGGTPEAVANNVVAASTDVTLKFNAALLAGAAQLDSQFFGLTGIDLDIRMADFYGLGQSIIADATLNGGAHYGITNVTMPCITRGAFSNQYYAPDAVANNCNSAASSDDLHPSARLHSLFGSTAISAVPEAPSLPLVAVALAALALVRRHNKRR
jgi:outer membrane lipase/esterase